MRPQQSIFFNILIFHLFLVYFTSVHAYPPTSFEPKKVSIAIADIHADPDAFMDILISEGILDNNGNMILSDFDLILLGDYTAKGNDTLKVWNMIYLLKEQAKFKNARIHTLMGNHDSVLLMENTKRISPADLIKFQQFSDNADQGVRAALVTSPYKEIYQDMRGMVKIGETMYVHAGVDHWIKDTTPEEINRQIREYVLAQQHYLEDKIAGRKCVRPEVPWVLEAWEFDSNNPWPDNPLWTRRLAQERLTTKEVDELLAYLDVKRIVIGHTQTETNVIEEIYDHRVVKLDTGNSQAFKKGRPSSIRIYEESGKIVKSSSILRGIGKEAYGCTPSISFIISRGLVI